MGIYILIGVLPLVALFIWLLLIPTSSYHSDQLLSSNFNTERSGTRVGGHQLWKDVSPGVTDKSGWYYQAGHLYHEPYIPADYTTDPQAFLRTMVVAGEAGWKNYIFTARVEPVDRDGVGVVFRYQNESNYYRFFMVADPAAGGPKISFDKRVGGTLSQIKAVSKGSGFHGNYESGLWYLLQVKAQGSHFEFYVDGEKVLSMNDSTFKSGLVGLATYQQDAAFFDDVQVSQISD